MWEKRNEQISTLNKNREKENIKELNKRELNLHKDK
jgi:hypothetical protein